MNYVPALPPFSYAYSCKYNGTGCSEIAMENVNTITITSTPIMDDLQNELRNRAMSESAITFDSISEMTAYNLNSKPNYVNWIANGGIVMKNSSISQQKYHEINKYYDNSIKTFVIIVSILILIAVLNPFYYSRQVALTGIGMFLLGIFGLNINKILWKESSK